MTARDVAGFHAFSSERQQKPSLFGFGSHRECLGPSPLRNSSLFTPRHPARTANLQGFSPVASLMSRKKPPNISGRAHPLTGARKHISLKVGSQDHSALYLDMLSNWQRQGEGRPHVLSAFAMSADKGLLMLLICRSKTPGARNSGVRPLPVSLYPRVVKRERIARSPLSEDSSPSGKRSCSMWRLFCSSHVCMGISCLMVLVTLNVTLCQVILCGISNRG